MPDELQFSPLVPGAAPVQADPADLDRLTGVQVELAVEIGRTRMSLGAALALGPGSIVTLDKLADQPVDLLVNGKPVARGEVVVIDEEFGLRITEVVGAPSTTPAELPPMVPPAELDPVAGAEA